MEKKDQLLVESVDGTSGARNGDWRRRLQPDFRQKTENRIMEYLKEHPQFSGEEGLLELKKTAVKFEEQSYTEASDQADYFKKIFLKMITITQSPMANASQPTPGNSNQNPANSGVPSNQQNVDMLQQSRVTVPQPLPSQIQSQQANGCNSLAVCNRSRIVQREICKEGCRLQARCYYPKLRLIRRGSRSSLNGNFHMGHQRDIPRQPKNKDLANLKKIDAMLEKLLQFLRLNENDIQISHRDKIGPWKKQIVSILNSHGPGKTVSSLPRSRMHAVQQNQKSQSQISQMQPHASQMSSQMQSSMNIQATSTRTRSKAGPLTVPENDDWRSQFPPRSRERIVNWIMETLKRHLLFSGQERLLRLRKTVVRFEERIYTAATSQREYSRRLALKMLSIQTKLLSPKGNSQKPNPGTGKQNRANSATSTRTSSRLVLKHGDWRSQLLPGFRKRVVNQIMEHLKKDLPFSGQERLLELQKYAVRFEEKMYTAATSLRDYLRKICQAPTIFQLPLGDVPHSDPGNSSQNKADSGMQDSAGLATAVPSAGGISPTSIPNATQNSMRQEMPSNISSVTHTDAW